MLGKMVGTDLNDVAINNLPAIRFYTPDGVNPLPTRFLSEEVGGGLEDLRNVSPYFNSNMFHINESCYMSHFILMRH